VRLAVVILSLSFLVQTQAASPPIAEIPFEFREGLIWVSVTVPQSPKPLNFLLDSGAAVSVVNLQKAKRLGLKLGERVRVRGIQTTTRGYWPQRLSAKAGAITLPKEYLAVDFCELSKACDCEVDGLLGADFFAEHAVQIDFVTNTIRLLEQTPNSPDAIVLPLKTSRRVLHVPVRVNSEEAAWLRLDTGCASALQYVSAARRRMHRRSEMSVGLARLSIPVVRSKVQLGDETFESVPTGLHQKELFPNEKGLLGNGLLSRFSRITIDAKAGVLLLEQRRD
jgi:predicted aspartyl protease